MLDFIVPWVASGHYDCVGMNERDAHAYDYEKQDAGEQDRYRAGAAPPGV